MRIAVSVPKKSVEVEFFLEFVHASARIDKLLLAGEERMALGADINLQVFFDGLGVVHRAAGTCDGGVFEFGMDSLFHCGFPHFQRGPDISNAKPIFHAGDSITQDCGKIKPFFLFLFLFFFHFSVAFDGPGGYNGI